MAFLEINNLVKYYGDNQVLKGVSLSMEKGEVITIIGDSGNGKTTLLRSLNALETIEGGNVVLEDREILPVKKKGISNPDFGMVFQGYNLFPQYTALENVVLPMNIKSQRIAKANKTKIDKKQTSEANIEVAKGLLTDIGLSEHMNKYPCQLSGGQCQRVAIARALALKPTVLCFDEPTSALDPRLTKEVCNIILKLKAEGHTMIIVTHDMDFCKMVSDHVYFMSKGQIHEHGTPYDLFTNPKTDEFKDFIGHIEEEKKELEQE